MNKNAQTTGNVGLYWVCYQLSLRGWNVMPTSRNAKGVDLIAYNYDCSRMISVQVKALSKKAPVPLGPSLDKVMGDVWIIVNNVRESPQTYILRPSEVKVRAHRGEKDGKVSFWLQPNAYCIEEYYEAWSRIGSPL